MTIPNIDAALYSKLTGTAAITALVSTRIYNLQAATNASLPYIVFNLASGLLDNTTPHQDVNHVYRVACVATTLASANSIHEAVHTALHRQSLSISGWSTFQVQNEGVVSFIENISGVQHFRIIGDYRIRASIS